MIKRFHLGQRVRNISFAAGVPIGTLGSVALVAGVRGKSIYCDPSRIMIFVRWDNGQSIGVFRRELEPAPAACKSGTIHESKQAADACDKRARANKGAQ